MAQLSCASFFRLEMRGEMMDIEKQLDEALERYENQAEQVRFFVNRGDVFQVGVKHFEGLSLGELNMFCLKRGYHWAIVSEGMGVIIR